MQKIWNRTNQTVWSLATVDAAGVGNMNICTYVTSISMKPKLMLVAIYHGTKTHANVRVTKRAILQLLSEDLAPVTRVCGHLSGNTVDKISRLQKRYSIETIDGIPIFSASPGYLELRLQKFITVEGDHDIAIFTVTRHINQHDTPILTTAYLRRRKLLR